MAEREAGNSRPDDGGLRIRLEAKLLIRYHTYQLENLLGHHGFATCADLSVPEQKYGKEDAFKKSIEWFKTHLVQYFGGCMPRRAKSTA